MVSSEKKKLILKEIFFSKSHHFPSTILMRFKFATFVNIINYVQPGQISELQNYTK